MITVHTLHRAAVKCVHSLWTLSLKTTEAAMPSVNLISYSSMFFLLFAQRFPAFPLTDSFPSQQTGLSKCVSVHSGLYSDKAHCLHYYMAISFGPHVSCDKCEWDCPGGCWTAGGSVCAAVGIQRSQQINAMLSVA